MFNDLREFLQKADELGQVKVIEGADWDLEIGSITELQLQSAGGSLLLFDKIKSYKPGYRVMTNFLNTDILIALAFGFPLEARGIELAKAWRDKFREEFKPVPPVEVPAGPVEENIDIGAEVDLFKFPTPKYHKLDGGRYIGTGCLVIQRDPDEGWVNLGTYRVQIHDKNRAGIFIAPGRHGDVIRRKYWERGLSCPTAVVCGMDPLLFTVAGNPLPWGLCEYDYAGFLRKEPVTVIKGKTTALPIPATAEIVLEGELMPPGIETHAEGPFGEFTGYYASGARDEAVFRVTSVMYRNDPIILGAIPLVGPGYGYGKQILDSGYIWSELDKIVPGVKGVWIFSEARGPSMKVISVQQKYAGHAKQAASFAAGRHAAADPCRFVIVVDDDIDPSNISDVLWALGTRCDPETSIDILRGCWGTPLDPVLPPEKRARSDFVHSRAIILACKPYYWLKEFPPSFKSCPEELAKTREKWGKLLFG